MREMTSSSATRMRDARDPDISLGHSSLHLAIQLAGTTRRQPCRVRSAARKSPLRSSWTSCARSAGRGRPADGLEAARADRVRHPGSRRTGCRPVRPSGRRYVPLRPATKACSTAFWTSSLMIRAHDVACWAGSVKVRVPSSTSETLLVWSSTPLRTSARMRFADLANVDRRWSRRGSGTRARRRST